MEPENEFVGMLAKNRRLAVESEEYRNCGFRVGSRVRLSDCVTRYKMEWENPPTKEDLEYEERIKEWNSHWNGAVVTVSDALMLYNPFTYEPTLCICVKNGDFGECQLNDYKADIAEVVEY